MSSKLRFASLRTSLFTVLGLSVAACGGGITTSELDPPDSGGTGEAEGGGGGAGGDTGTLESVCEGSFGRTATGGEFSGFVECPDGSLHRKESVKADPTIGAAACKGTESRFSCREDSDCNAEPYGRCISRTFPNFDTEPNGPAYITECGCHYACVSDDDCEGGACIPAGIVPSKPGAFCAPADCRTGEDCASGDCGLSVYDDGCGIIVSLGCHDTSDGCRVDADCEDWQACAYSSSTWSCTGPSCAIGRPLLIDGRARTAAATSRHDWAASELLPNLTGLDPALRDELANHWLEVAAMEHASIGSFARFSLQLLALGAPPDLLADTQKAALDEVEHARIAYALASAYAGRKLGPGPLDASDAPLVTCRKEAIRSLIFEACVGETLGVAEALAIADNVRDPALADILRRIAEDEQRHAELAFRTLSWLLENASFDEIEEAELAFAEAVRASARDPEVSRMAIPEHGVLDAKALGALRRQALAEVVEPCAAALLERSKIAA